ncbi:MAG TPA: biopolymer transporter ExbD [Candidatus Babeliales bacterium]|jgi:biopolymer transport protein TolR|nr:biopolymer transporter ExbD [Candidatus Babeliales bacterium]
MRTRYIRRSRKHKSALSDLSMTPLIDTALTLLIIFMVATPVLQNAIKVTLPRGNAQEDASKNQQELVVFIDKQGDFYINKEKVAKADLIAQIKKTVGNDHEKTVYVKADTAISYGTVIELVDDIKFVGGIKYVALATQKHSQKTPSLG